jgi:hypothetical protein
VHVADFLMGESNPAAANNAEIAEVDSVYLARLGLNERMDCWRALREVQND